MSYIGNDKIKKVYLGNENVKKIYLGNDIVFQSRKPFSLLGRTEQTEGAIYDYMSDDYIINSITYRFSATGTITTPKEYTVTDDNTITVMLTGASRNIGIPITVPSGSHTLTITSSDPEFSRVLLGPVNMGAVTTAVVITNEFVGDTITHEFGALSEDTLYILMLSCPTAPSITYTVDVQ